MLSIQKAPYGKTWGEQPWTSGIRRDHGRTQNTAVSKSVPGWLSWLSGWWAGLAQGTVLDPCLGLGGFSVAFFFM